MSNEYRTAQGKSLNMETLALQNELTPAVGNSSVNARGDEIDSSGRIVRSRAEIMKEYHKLHTPIDAPKQSELKEDE